MFELLTIAIFIWLMVKAIGLALKLTWGVAKIAASILIGLAFPVLTGPATIVDMRRKTHHHHSNGHHHHTHSYHITFEKEDGEWLELKVKRYEYNELSVGDRGVLTHQGTRYKGFER